MEKPYDVKVLLERLKKKGLDIGEKALKEAFETTCDWAEESAKASKTPVDDLALPFIPALRGFVGSKIDKVSE